ncbi:hypothetical protein BDR07DRAFT_125339 [Suillus spraguei]|nr:hypothetical protein BDR07DRAFT_125339 [Suillus spraguei]
MILPGLNFRRIPPTPHQIPGNMCYLSHPGYHASRLELLTVLPTENPRGRFLPFQATEEYSVEIRSNFILRCAHTSLEFPWMMDRKALKGQSRQFNMIDR